MRVLVIDNNIDPDCWGARDLARFAVKTPGAEVHVRRAPHADLPTSPGRYDRIIVSGSKTSCLDDAPWIAALERFVRSSIDAGKPLLGVCYGHQVLARVLGGKTLLRKATDPEFGWTRIEQVGDSRLLRDLPRVFHTFSSHHEEVHSAPRGMNVVARSADCQIQAMELEDKPVFGIQFHPEKTADEGEASLRSRAKKGLKPTGTGLGKSSSYYDSKIAETLFSKFMSIGSHQ